jgi:hypothetical protein
MKHLVFAVALLLAVPFLRAQQTETSGSPPPAAPQPTPETAPQSATQNPSAQEQLPANLRPGHPLDPADVDILTGKRDRELAAARRAAVPVMASPYGEYGYYGDYFWMNGRLGGTWDIPTLPLTRIANPFFFSPISQRGFRGGGFGGRR